MLAHLPDYLKPVFQVAYITGWRTPSEILTRRKSHLDLNAGWLRLEPGETKNREGRMFPLTPMLRDVLTSQLERTRALDKFSPGRVIPWLFHRDGKPIRDFYDAWHKACKAAGMPGRIPHDFRRTAVRNLERAGVPRSAAMQLTGHITESVIAATRSSMRRCLTRASRSSPRCTRPRATVRLRRPRWCRYARRSEREHRNNRGRSAMTGPFLFTAWTAYRLSRSPCRSERKLGCGIIFHFRPPCAKRWCCGRSCRPVCHPYRSRSYVGCCWRDPSFHRSRRAMNELKL